MPRTDSVTGCQVMTLPEFWAAEAKSEGREVWEIYEDFIEDEAAANRAYEQNLMNDVANANQMFREADQADEEASFGFKEVIAILDAMSSESGRGSGASLLVLAQCTEGKACLLLSWSSYAGSMLDPPDYDEDLVKLTPAAVLDKLLACAKQSSPNNAQAVDRLARATELFRQHGLV